ncbi:hypothetical protein AOQ84DRAFT_402651 [Glonium stellatum]|uniref:DUF7779 domain-containing protein n=1 Tax=Glonium stellatum TaxID=574774 RepID=A0A8E2JUF6_9PEZI|nr:hypothetical protein AOQ84DRAFT_402651 [Glonium stellatum]
MSSELPCRLRQVDSNGSVPPSKAEVQIIYVPELSQSNKKGKRSWTAGQLPWALLEHAPQARVFEYDYGFDALPSDIWLFLIYCGEELRKALNQHFKSSENEYLPLLFICHGFGGLVVKHMLITSHEKQPETFARRLFQAFSGIVFQGTPHPTYRKRSDWRKLISILRSVLKCSRPFLVQAEHKTAVVADICQKFEEADFAVPVISVFEGQETRTFYDTSHFQSRKEKLVDLAFAETHSRCEKMIEKNNNHHDLIKFVKEDAEWQEVMGLITMASNRPPEQLFTAAVASPVARSLSVTETLQECDALPYVYSQPRTSDLESSNYDNWVRALPDPTSISTIELTCSMASGVEAFNQKWKTTKLPIFYLKPHVRNPDFCGRQNILSQIETHLSPCSYSIRKSKEGIRSFALSGLGGIGKTQVAIEYAFSRRHLYDMVFWIHAGSVAKLNQSFVNMAAELRLLDVKNPGSHVLGRKVALEWLSISSTELDAGEGVTNHTGVVKWLLVFDNVDNPNSLHDFWPSSGTGSILMTSRDPYTKHCRYDNQASRTGADLDSLSMADSANLLRRLTDMYAYKDLTENSSFTTLYQRLEGLPLAIVQVSAFIQARQLTLQEVVNMLVKDQYAAKVLESNSGSSHPRYNHTVCTVWALDDLDDPAKCLLNLLSFLDSDNINEELLTKLQTEQPIQHFPSNVLDYIEARTSLLRASLIKRNPEENQLTIHRLVQNVVRVRMNKQQGVATFNQVVRLLYNSWPFDDARFSHSAPLWKAMNPLIPHILKTISLYGTYQSDLGVTDQYFVARLFIKGGWHLRESGDFDLSKEMITSALTICEQHPNELAEEMADSLFSLASLLNSHNQQKAALPYAERHFAQRMKVGLSRSPCPMKRAVATAHSELALSYMQNNRIKEGLELSREAQFLLEQRPEFRNGERWPEFPMMHQAIMLLELGSIAEAEELLLKTIEWRERRYGPNDTNSFKLGYALGVLAKVRERQSRWDESFGLLQRALNNLRETKGDSHMMTNMVYRRLAEHHARIGNIESASIFFDKALRSFEVHDYARPELVQCTFKMAGFLEGIGDKTRAAALYSRARKLYWEVVQEEEDPGRLLTAEDFDKVVSLVRR